MQMNSVQATGTFPDEFLPLETRLQHYDLIPLLKANDEKFHKSKIEIKHCIKDGFVYKIESNGHYTEKKIGFFGKSPLKKDYQAYLDTETFELKSVSNFVCNECLGKRIAEMESRRVNKKYLPMVVDSKKYLPAVIRSQPYI
jgi:hypothetical protein